MANETSTKGVCRIEYTTERRGTAKRHAVEVPVAKVDAKLAQLEERGAFNFDLRYELP